MTLSERLNGSATERVFQAPNDLSVSLRVLKCRLGQVATLNLTISDEILKSRAKTWSCANALGMCGMRVRFI